MTSPTVMNSPKLYIIILNWNGLQDTLECLESVFKLDYPNFEIIVVDNGSTDDSAAVIRKNYHQVTLIENKENLGYTGGNNIAMRYAMEHGADYMWLLNNDTVVEPDTLSKIVATAESDPKIGLVSPVIYYYDAPDKIQFCGSYVDWENQAIVYPTDKNLNVLDDFKNGGNVCLWGTSILVKRGLVEKIGYLDEKLFSYWEDTDYSLRSLRFGYKNLLCTSTKIFHKTQLPMNGPTGRKPYFFYYMARNNYFVGVNYFKKFMGLHFMGNYLSYIVISVMSRINNNNYEDADAVLNGAWAAFRGIGGPWDKTIKMPNTLKRIFYFFCSWHPYFWASLLKGEFSHIVSDVTKRIKLRLITLYTNR